MVEFWVTLLQKTVRWELQYHNIHLLLWGRKRERRESDKGSSSPPNTLPIIMKPYILRRKWCYLETKMVLRRSPKVNPFILLDALTHTGPLWVLNPQPWHCKHHALPTEPHENTDSLPWNMKEFFLEPKRVCTLNQKGFSYGNSRSTPLEPFFSKSVGAIWRSRDIELFENVVFFNRKPLISLLHTAPANIPYSRASLWKLTDWMARSCSLPAWIAPWSHVWGCEWHAGCTANTLSITMPTKHVFGSHVVFWWLPSWCCQDQGLDGLRPKSCNLCVCSCYNLTRESLRPTLSSNG